MEHKYINYDRLLNKITNKDKIFLGDYTLDPFQNCEFKCSYCDSSNNNVIYIKNNYLKLLKNEITKLDNIHNRIIIGSVVDPYQPIERKLKITRDILKNIKSNKLPVHILTKSDIVLRDIDILSKIKNCLVTISIISLNTDIYNLFEKNVISSLNRLKIIKKLKNNNIRTGLAIMPILPFITDNEIELIIKNAKENEAEYILHKHLELKGIQKSKFMKELSNFNPDLISKYEKLYYNSYKPNYKYLLNIKKIVEKYCLKYNVSNFIV
jgi:DNA repair photolyase